MPELLDIVGQDEALGQLQRALQSGRQPHAFLFAGPEGVGRETTAMQLAKLLLCEAPVKRPNSGRLAELPQDAPLLVPCNRCPSCVTASAGTNPNLILIFKELARFHDDAGVRRRKMQELGLAVIQRFLIAPAHMTSFGGRGRVFIVRQAELMSVEAQNALLKTLEEPPAQVTIILLSTSVEELLPTTRSRCQVVRFHALPIDFVAKRLEASGVSAEEARFWAAMTGGSLGQSLHASQNKLFAFKRDLVGALAGLSEAKATDLAELLVRAMGEQAERLTKAAKTQDKTADKASGDAEDEEEGEDSNLAATLANRLAGQTILSLLVSVYRDALHVATGADASTGAGCHGQPVLAAGHASAENTTQAVTPASASTHGQAKRQPDHGTPGPATPLIHADQKTLIGTIARRSSPLALAELLGQLALYEEMLWRNVNIKLLWDNVALTCAATPA